MTYGYTIELRTKALSYLDSGKSRKEVCEAFGISLKTLFNWIKLRKSTGNLEMQSRSAIRSHRKLHEDDLKGYIEKHPDHYLTEIAAAFDVKSSSVFMALKKFGITRKKNTMLHRKR